jgi:flagellar FliL protein
MANDSHVAREASNIKSKKRGTSMQRSAVTRILLFAAVGLAVLVGVASGAYITWFVGRSSGPVSAVPGGAEMGKTSHFLDLDELMINLDAANGGARVLKLHISLELEKTSDEQRVRAVMPRIVDNFQVFLRELRVEELEGSHGLYRIKEEMLTRVNAAAHPTKVKDVLIKKMLIQ